MPEVSAIIKLVGKDQASSEIRKVQNAVKDLGNASKNKKGFLSEFLGDADAKLKAGAIAAGLLYVGKESLKAAAALEALESRSKSVYGESFPLMQQRSDKLAVSLGRSSSDILRLATDFSTLASGAGMPSKSMEEMGSSLAELTVDLASFFHLSEDEAFQTLQSGMLGMGRQLKRLGIDLDDTALSAFALSRGLKQEVEDMNDAQKMALRYALLMEKTNEIQGDASRNAGNLSNQWQRMKGIVGDLFEELGKPALPATAYALGQVNAALEGGIILLKGLSAGASATFGHLQSVFSALAGIAGAAPTLPKGVGVMAGLSETDISSGFGPAGGKLSFAMVEQEKKAKALREEIRLLGQGFGGLGKGTDKAADELDKVKEAMEDVTETYEDARKDIDRNIKELEFNHREKMDSLKKDLMGVQGELKRMEREYARTVAKIQEEQAKLNKQSGEDEAAIFAKQEKNLAAMKQRLEDLGRAEGAIDMERIVGVIRNRGGYGPTEGDLTAKQQQAFNLTDSQAEQVNLTMELQKEEAAYAKFAEDRKRLEKEVAAEREKLRQTETEREIAALRERNKEDQARLKERAQEEKSRYGERRRENTDRQQEIQQSAAREQEAFILMRQEYERNRAGLQAFHDSYVSNMANLDKVTLDTVDSMKKKLEELRETVSNIDALLQSKAAITGGGTLSSRVSQRRTERLSHTPDSYLVPNALGGIYDKPTAALIGEAGYPEAVIPMPFGNVPVKLQGGKGGSIEFNAPLVGQVIVKNEADEDRLVQKLVRMIQLQKLQA